MKFVRRMAAIIVVGWMLNSQAAWAYMPTGWTWSAYPYAYDYSYRQSWYYLNESDAQWGYKFSTGTWSLFGESELSSGWVYYQWPYAYSSQAGSWFYLEEAYDQWCVRMDSGIWSRLGRSTCETYEDQVADFKVKYSKSNEWASWMITNKGRYGTAFEAAKARPGVVTVSFQYETTPISYSPPWASENQHMDTIATMVEGIYPSYLFRVEFNGDTSSSYANITAGTAGTTSYASGKNVYLYYETIFHHEFGHVMRIRHHYDTIEYLGKGTHMPPGETQCLMDRTFKLFCSACRTALGIPLDITDTTVFDQAASDIIGRYPY